MPDPVTILLTALGTSLAVETVKGGVKGTVEGYKQANKESAEFFLQAFYILACLAPLDPHAHWELNPRDYYDELRHAARPNFSSKAKQEQFMNLLKTRDPKFLALAVTAASTAAVALYPYIVAKGTVKGVGKRLKKFFDF